MKPSKFTLHTAAINGGPFNYRHAMSHELAADKIMCNEYPIFHLNQFKNTDMYALQNSMRLWLIGHQFGAICAVWATNEQDALNAAVDLNLMDGEQVSQEDFEAASEEERENFIYLGNASEPFYQDYLWILPVDIDIVRDFALIIAFARCEDADSLDY